MLDIEVATIVLSADEIEVLVQVLPVLDEMYTVVLVVATITDPELDIATYEKSPLIEDDDDDQLVP